MRRLVVFCLAALLGLAACAPAATAVVSPTGVPGTTPAPSERAELTVFAAASLTDAFGELRQSFEAAHPGVTVVYNFAGSNQLAQQLGQGAAADVFASANGTQMNVAITASASSAARSRPLCRTGWWSSSRRDNPAGISSLADLAKPGLKLVLAAKEVPVGQYALDFLDRAAQDPAYGEAYKTAVLANVVSYEENVRAVLAKVTLGEADAGFVYSSDVGEGGQAAQLDIPDPLNTIAKYPIAPVSDSAHPELAQAFIDLVLSAPGQAILKEYGFIPVHP